MARVNGRSPHPIKTNDPTVEVFTVEPVRNGSTAITPPPTAEEVKSKHPHIVFRVGTMLILGFFAIVLLNPLWFFAARVDLIAQYYGRSLFAAEMLTVVYFVMGSLCPFLAIFSLQFLNNKTYLTLICYAACLGFWVRCEGTGSVDIENRYGVALMGQLIMGVAHAFYTLVPYRVIAVWFIENQRLALMLYGFMYKFGLFASYICSVFSFNGVSNDTSKILFWDFHVTAAFATILIVLVFVGIPNHEKKIDQPGMVATLSRNFKDRPTLFMVLSFGMFSGSYDAFISMLGLFASAKPNNHLVRNWAGTLSLLAYIIGAISIIPIMRCADRTRSFLMILPAGCLLVMIIFTALLNVWEETTLIIISAILGWLYGVLYEIECNKIWTQPEEYRTVIVAMIFSCSQVSAFFLTTVGSKMFDHYQGIAPSSLLVVYMVASFIITVVWQMKFDNRVRQVSVVPQQNPLPVGIVPNSADTWM